MKNICFYHKVDYDGKSSGALIRMYCEYFEEEITLIPINYGHKIEYSQIDKDTRVFMVDFTLCDRDAEPQHRAEPMARINELAGEFIWIDHHGSSIADVNNYIEKLELKGVRDTRFSGTELTWLYLFNRTSERGMFPKNINQVSPSFGYIPISDLSTRNPNYCADIPRIIYLLGRYDVWDHQLDNWDDILAFQFGMRIYGDWKPENDEAYREWTRLFYNHNIAAFEKQVISQGVTVLAYLNFNNSENVKNSGYEAVLTFKDGTQSEHTFFALNSSLKNSGVFDSIRGKYDAYIAYSHNHKGWSISIYSFDPKICNAADLCVKFGGGGHPGAAGFVWPQEKPLPFIPTKIEKNTVNNK